MSNLKQRAAIRGLMEDVAAEMKWAVGDIRNELVERSWYGHEITPNIQGDMNALSPQEQDTLGAKDYGQASRDDLYGPESERTHEQERDQEIDR